MTPGQPMPTLSGIPMSATSRLITSAIADMGMPESVGIGCPGVIDGEHGMVVTGGNLGWENKPLAQDLGKQLGIPVTLCSRQRMRRRPGGCPACGAGQAYRSIVPHHAPARPCGA